MTPNIIGAPFSCDFHAKDIGTPYASFNTTFFLSPGGERFPHLNFISLALRWPTIMFQDNLQPICLGLHYRIKDRAPGHANNKITAIVIETSTLYLGAYPHHQISICGYRLEIHCVLVNPCAVARSKKVSWAFMDSWTPELRLL